MLSAGFPNWSGSWPHGRPVHGLMLLFGLLAILSVFGSLLVECDATSAATGLGKVSALWVCFTPLLETNLGHRVGVG